MPHENQAKNRCCRSDKRQERRRHCAAGQFAAPPVKQQDRPACEQGQVVLPARHCESYTESTGDRCGEALSSDGLGRHEFGPRDRTEHGKHRRRTFRQHRRHGHRRMWKRQRYEQRRVPKLRRVQPQLLSGNNDAQREHQPTGQRAKPRISQRIAAQRANRFRHPHEARRSRRIDVVLDRIRRQAFRRIAIHVDDVVLIVEHRPRDLGHEQKR